jgi:hypothetical protein
MQVLQFVSPSLENDPAFRTWLSTVAVVLVVISLALCVAGRLKTNIPRSRKPHRRKENEPVDVAIPRGVTSAG